MDNINLMDEAVQGTNDDACISKLSAINKGYYEDPYLQYFIKVNKVTKRSPLINRGYYARVSAVWKLLNNFLCIDIDSSPIKDSNIHNNVNIYEKQIISLGAGYDTSFMRLLDKNLAATRYIELDFPEVIRTKAKLISKYKILSNDKYDYNYDINENNILRTHWKYTSKDEKFSYHLIGVDLRNFDEFKKLLETNIDFTIPTLILSECALVYISPNESKEIIKYFANQFNEKNNGGGAIFIAYEQINPNDRFGQTMMNHLKNRGCSLKSLQEYPNIEAQHNRFISLGWQNHSALSMNNIYKYYLPKDDIKRIEKIEIFDEFEEWHIINDHYSINVATIDTKKTKMNLKKLGFSQILLNNKIK